MLPRFDLPRVTAVRYVRDHVLWLEFNDGLCGTVDMSEALAGPMFDGLRDPVEFSRVRLGAETIEWPNGADWAPESLHAQVVAGNGSTQKSDGDGASPAAVQAAGVPELSRFYGIVITMYYSDHARPHFHARSGSEVMAVEIDGDGLHGSFPPGRLPLVFEWRDRHRDELRENWSRMRRGHPPVAIAPLE